MAVSNSAAVCTTDAKRISVSKTRSSFGGTPTADSAVTSVTKDLRIGYPSVECNILDV